jgi:hypothetical protein
MLTQFCGRQLKGAISMRFLGGADKEIKYVVQSVAEGVPEWYL